MARLRTLKPSFFTHEELGELSPLHRLLFQGLWCYADRDGYLEDRPKLLKTVVLPYDKCDIDALLTDLAVKGFIVRYLAGGKRCIHIPAFGVHQKPHAREPSYELPSLPSRVQDVQSIQPEQNSDEPEIFPAEHDQIPAGPTNPHMGSKTKDQRPLTKDHSPPTKDQTGPDELAAAWNELRGPASPTCRELGDQRRRAATAALKRRPLEQWREVFRRIAASDMCQGRTGLAWVADFDWAIRPGGIKPEPALRALEGSLDARASGSNAALKPSNPAIAVGRGSAPPEAAYDPENPFGGES
jgi:hypothetical protein